MSNRYADREIGNKKAIFKDEFLRVLAQTTMLRLFDLLIYNDLAEAYRHVFKMLDTIPQIKEPTFAFIHIMLPHHPFVFDRFGNTRKHMTFFNQFQQGAWEDKEGYLGQVVFLNNKLKETIDVLLRKSEVSPIIVIQSDHGPKISKNIDKDFVKARMANFQAFYLPDGKSADLYESITPVNTFRIIFNAYFQTEYELLEDKCYYSAFARPYAFNDVTRECN